MLRAKSRLAVERLRAGPLGRVSWTARLPVIRATAPQAKGGAGRRLQRQTPFGIGGRMFRRRGSTEFGCGCSSGVEHDLAKVGVEGSNPFARSNFFHVLLSHSRSEHGCALRSR